MGKKYLIKKMGDKMLAIKNDKILLAAKDTDVAKAIAKSNEKHAEMMAKLAK